MPKQEYYTYNAWITPKPQPSKKPQALMNPAEMAEAMNEKERQFILYTTHNLLRSFRDGETLRLHTPAGKSDSEAYPPRVLLGIATELFNAGWIVRFQWLSSWDYRSWNFGWGGGKFSYPVHLSPRSSADVLL